MRYEKTYSTSRPDETDLVSSPTSVYVRKNITELAPDGNGTVMFEYDEVCIPKDEYIAQSYTENTIRDDVLQELILAVYSGKGE